jgi:hypothetical protein
VSYLPRAPELLDEVQRSLIEEILPKAQPQLAYGLRMAANAVAIAAREIRQRPQGNPGATPVDAMDQEQLCEAIRAGHFDSGEQRSQLIRRLRRDVADALMISNPKARRE